MSSSVENQSAIKIQSLMRGHLSRRRFKNIVESVVYELNQYEDRSFERGIISRFKSGWNKCINTNGYVYFNNPNVGVTQWQEPLSLKDENEWKIYRNIDFNQYYYYCEAINESTWTFETVEEEERNSRKKTKARKRRKEMQNGIPGNELNSRASDYITSSDESYIDEDRQMSNDVTGLFMTKKISTLDRVGRFASVGVSGVFGYMNSVAAAISNTLLQDDYLNSIHQVSLNTVDVIDQSWSEYYDNSFHDIEGTITAFSSTSSSSSS